MAVPASSALVRCFLTVISVSCWVASSWRLVGTALRLGREVGLAFDSSAFGVTSVGWGVATWLLVAEGVLVFPGGLPRRLGCAQLMSQLIYTSYEMDNTPLLDSGFSGGMMARVVGLRFHSVLLDVGRRAPMIRQSLVDWQRSSEVH